MDINNKLVSFYDMPKNIEEILTRDDYIQALFNSYGLQRGIFETIHLNPKYPQWRNILFPSGTMDYIFAFTGKDWEQVHFDTIWRQMHNEYINCFIYIFKRKDELFSEKND